MARQLFIQQADYISNLTVELKFNNGMVRRIDFTTFLQDHSHPQYNNYFNPLNFKKFYLDHGIIVWGKNWDLIFPVEKLYKGEFS